MHIIGIPKLSESVLISILYMIRLVSWPKSQHKKRRGRPYVYSPTVILRCFVDRIWLRLDSNRSLHDYLAMDYPYNRRVLRVCGLTSLPDRRTFDRRLSTISVNIKERISTMGNLFPITNKPSLIICIYRPTNEVFWVYKMTLWIFCLGICKCHTIKLFIKSRTIE
jgi:hypothetical protein